MEFEIILTNNDRTGLNQKGISKEDVMNIIKEKLNDMYDLEMVQITIKRNDFH